MWLGLIALVIGSALAVPVATAAAAEVRVVGQSTEKGCNAGVPVRFDLFIKHGRLDHVLGFQAKGFNYPKITRRSHLAIRPGAVFPAKTTFTGAPS